MFIVFILFVISYFVTFLPICFFGWCGQTIAGLEFSYRYKVGLGKFQCIYWHSLKLSIPICIVTLTIMMIK